MARGSMASSPSERTRAAAPGREVATALDDQQTPGGAPSEVTPILHP
jgi:hypothetical protein